MTTQTNKGGDSPRNCAGVKHTPAPWIAGNSTGIGAHEVMGDGSQLVALIYGRSKEEQDANAAVIAAAPDLLDALKALLVCAEAECVSGSSYEPIQEARAAILQAEGGVK